MMNDERGRMNEKYDSRPETIGHIFDVQAILANISFLLAMRGVNHDHSKLHSPEKELFDEYTPKLRNTTYGSDEYKVHLEAMGEALRHHYDHNSHHPEHFKDGVDGMSLLDLIEMFCDWKAATGRHADGDIRKSIEINAQRFGISNQLKQILINTCNELGW